MLVYLRDAFRVWYSPVVVGMVGIGGGGGGVGGGSLTSQQHASVSQGCLHSLVQSCGGSVGGGGGEGVAEGGGGRRRQLNVPATFKCI